MRFGVTLTKETGWLTLGVKNTKRPLLRIKRGERFGRGVGKISVKGGIPKEENNLSLDGGRP